MTLVTPLALACFLIQPPEKPASGTVKEGTLVAVPAVVAQAPPKPEAAARVKVWIMAFDPSVDPRVLPINPVEASKWIRVGRPAASGEAHPPSTNGLAQQTIASEFKVDAGGFKLSVDHGTLATTPDKGTPPWNLVAAPQIVAAIAQEAEITIGRQVTYLEKNGPDCLVVRESPDAFEGVSVKLKVERASDREIRFSNIELNFSQVTGRQSVEGVPLDVGRPIISSRATSLGLTIAPDQIASIPLPQSPGEQTLMIFLMAAKND